MRVLLLFPLLITAVSGRIISYKGVEEPDQVIETQVIEQQYSYATDRLNQRKLPLDQKIYDGKFSGKGISIYVIDTGMLENDYYNFTCGYNFIGDPCDCSSAHRHGTHVGSLIGSKLFGMAPKSNVINLKVLDDSGRGMLSSVLDAMDHILSNNVTCAIVNLSLGALKSESLNGKIEEVVDAGNHVVVAAGNSGRDACDYSPSSAPKAITVGSIDMNDKKTSFSNSGKCVDVYSPGLMIPGAIGGPLVGSLSGTSMSSPLVAGLLALQMEKDGCDASLRKYKIKKRFKVAFFL